MDVLVSECMGNFFVTDEMQPVLRDAARFVRPGGRVCPERISLRLAPAWLPTFRELRFWEEQPAGFDFSAALPFALHRTYVLRVEPEFLVAEDLELAGFPLLEAPDEIAGALAFPIEKARTIHGFVGWFVAYLAPGIVLDTGPTATPTHWGQLLFPVSPLRAAPGDRLELHVELAMDPRYQSTFRWWGRLRRGDATVARFAHDTSARFSTAAPTGEAEARG